MASIEKWRKATISFVIYACLSFLLSAWDNSATTGRIFMKSDMYFSKIYRENSGFIKIG